MKDKDRLRLLVNRREREIFLPELIYAEAHNREISFFLPGKEIRGYYRISKLEKELPANFCRCHRSFIVNMDYVDRIDGADVVMMTGERIPLPRKKRRVFTERLYKQTIRE